MPRTWPRWWTPGTTADEIRINYMRTLTDRMAAFHRYQSCSDPASGEWKQHYDALRRADDALLYAELDYSEWFGEWPAHNRLEIENHS